MVALKPPALVPSSLLVVPSAIPGDPPVLRMRRPPKFVPAGFRIAENGIDLELVAHDRWPTNPFDRYCQHRTMPNDTLIVEARFFLPAFDPDGDRLAWGTLGDLIRQLAGRSADEIAAMSQQDVIACLRACRASSTVATLATNVVRREPACRRDGSRPNQSKQKATATVDQRLKELHQTSPAIAEGRSLRYLGRLLKCSPSAFIGGEYYEKVLKPIRERARAEKADERSRAENRQVCRDNRSHQESFEPIDEELDEWFDERKRNRSP